MGVDVRIVNACDVVDSTSLTAVTCLARLTNSIVCFIVGRSGVVLVISEITPDDDRRDVYFSFVGLRL